MPVYDIVPESVSGSEYMAATGAASVVAALSDASDSSYAKSTSSAFLTRYLLSDPSSPTGRLCSIGVYVRNKKPGASQARAWLAAVTDSSGINSGAWLVYPTGAAIVDSEILAHQGQNPDDAAFVANITLPLANRLMLQFDDQNVVGANNAFLYEALARLYYLPAVTCGTPSAPAGTVTTTQRPVCTTALSLVVESWQLPSGLPTFLTGGDVEFAIYKSADAPGAAPPVTPDPVWTGSVRFSETTAGTRTPSVSATPDVYLPNGSYVVYARTSRDLMSGSQLYWSAWAKSAEWTQDLALPTAPTLTPKVDDANQRMVLSVNCPATDGYNSVTRLFELQRLVGGVWRDVRGLGDFASGFFQPDFFQPSFFQVVIDGSATTGYDYECERAATNTYRARYSMTLAADASVRRWSAWAELGVTGPALTGWNLKTVADPAGNMTSAPVVAEPSEDSQAKVGLFEVLDRELPVAVSSTLGGMSGALSLSVVGSAKIVLLEALRDYAGLVLLETAFGDVKYIRLTKVSWIRRGTAAAPRRLASITYAEVGCDLPESTT